jgi:hypothetical protein
MEKKWYVYVDQKPCGEVFYIGKGNARRVKHERRNRFHTFVTIKHPEWKRDIVFTGTEEDCLKTEESLILKYGRRDLGTGTLVNLTAGGEGTVDRVVYQEERDRLSKSWSGDKNPLFNFIEFEWVNLDTGVTEKSTIFEMHKKYGGSRAHWTTVTNGSRKSHYGWALVGTKINVRSSKGKVFTFKNDKLDSFTGTQSDFCKKTGISVASASRIVTGKAKNKEGWYV